MAEMFLIPPRKRYKLANMIIIIYTESSQRNNPH